MRLKATRELYYGRTIRAGEEFEAKDHHGKVLKQIKKAIDAPVKPATPPPEPVAEVVPPMTTETAAPLVPYKPRGRYARRDMRAGDDDARPLDEGDVTDRADAAQDVLAPEAEAT